MEALAVNSISQVALPTAGAATSSPAPRKTGESVSRQAAALVGTPTKADRQAALPQEGQINEASMAPSSKPPPSIGRIRFELDDGTRVAKFFDTKDVLIYQVPPEGTLYLVRIQEASVQDQVETSA